ASKPYEQITSDSIAESVNTNPVVIRRMCGLLKKGGILTSRAGISGAILLKSPADISLLDIYLAVQSKSEWFALHDHPNHDCPIGCKIYP
ncbi:Rrf2 family transcriptional regulator, partial [Campylobacter upsaliensis]|nr:Rrf2 family transcriptional regulator [Campylobacter upsaliensis]